MKNRNVIKSALGATNNSFAKSIRSWRQRAQKNNWILLKLVHHTMKDSFVCLACVATKTFACLNICTMQIVLSLFKAAKAPQIKWVLFTDATEALSRILEFSIFDKCQPIIEILSKLFLPHSDPPVGDSLPAWIICRYTAKTLQSRAS